MYVGVDGHAKGWVSIVIDDDGFVAAGDHRNFGELLERHRKARVIGVDIPLGLDPEAAREADAAAREYLASKRASIFPAPPRPVLAARDYAEANRRHRELTGKGLSAQSFALFAKIREVDVFVDDPRLFEVHPEAAFWAMTGETTALASKKSWAGLHARLDALRGEGIALPASMGDAGRVPIDDVVDAAAAAWSARRIACGRATRFPAQPIQTDASGRALAIWV